MTVPGDRDDTAGRFAPHPSRGQLRNDGGGPGQDRFDAVITPEIRARLALPTGEGGTCLPNACYTSPDWLALENERLFARTWMYAACLDQLARPGDAFPTRIGDKPVLLVHGDTHWQRVDKPLRNPANGKRLANFTRAETFGYPFMGWVKVFIEPDRPALFRFEAHPWPQPGN